MRKKHRLSSLALSLLLVFLWFTGQTPALARKSVISPGPVLEDINVPTDQIIIKYKSKTGAFFAPAQDQQMKRLDDTGGVHFQYFRAMSSGAQVIKLPERLPIAQVYAITEKLKNLPEVEYAEPDQILQHTLTPNDPQYSNQWDLWDTQGINAPAAWDITTGSSSIVVADVDTGITNHVDLSGRTVPGYDFISNAQIANDGNGRDSDPSDPGDWITYSESSNPSSIFYGCLVENSSWHGTHTAGTIGASGDNSIGIAGINWNSKILPVRVLGKCGGYNSDIIDGMLWAAGLPVSGVPANPNPAKVLNLSLGGTGSCSTTFQNAINQITAAGAVVVVAAGNSGVNVSNSVPANCNGVISVSATASDGSLASYSNYGSKVKISAPGGDFNKDVGILSTLNTGTTVPVSDTYGYYQGTSMAAPHVTGVVSLMFSLDPALTPSQALQILQSTAQAFPSGSTCNTSICGAGIVDARAALNGVLTLIGVNITGNVGAGGVSLSYTDGSVKTVTSQLDGSYTITVPYGWSGTVTPSESCLTFTPSDTSYSDLTTNQTNQDYSYSIDSDCAGVSVSIADSPEGTYFIPSSTYKLVSYPGTNGGPLFVNSTNGVPIVSSIRLLYLNKYSVQTYSELMGVPTSQLLDDYWLPTYIDNSLTDTQIRFTNTSTTQSTTVQVSIGGVLKGTYPLTPSSALRVNYPGVSGGPVRIQGTAGVPILAGMRVIYGGIVGGSANSFDELMAYPTAQLSNEYWFPFYNHNNANLDTQLRVANTSSSQSSTVQIYIGGNLMGTYPLAPSTDQLITYPGVNGGPVHIVGTSGVPIVTSLRLLYVNKYGYQTYSELMGVPTSQLLDDYAMPVYIDDSMTDSQIRFTNTSTTQSTTVRVYLGSTLMGSYPLTPSSALRVNYTGMTGGPIRIVGTPGVPILAGMRVIYGGVVGGSANSFDELMAYPTANLSSQYWFPFYNHNNVNLFTEARFAAP